MEKECVICGQKFNTKKSTQQCCSTICANKKAHETVKKYVICQHCGKPFWRKNAFRMKFCSKECQSAARALLKKPKPEPVIYRRECAWCGSPFETTLSKKKYCSSDCAYKGNLRHKREQWANQYIPKTYVCKECGTKFTTECGNKHSVFCCQTCAEKYERRQEHQTERHKAYIKECKLRREKQMRQQYAGLVSYDALYQRDYGVCQICGMAVHPDKFCDDSWGGTIDHIIPLSVGGEHSMSNCQLAHRICNSLKGKSEGGFILDWAEKAGENNYWSVKYNAYLALMRRGSVCAPPNGPYISTAK